MAGAVGFYVFRSYVAPTSGQPVIPVSGYNPNSTASVNADYYLPPVSGQDKRTLHINKSGQAFTDMEHMAGQYPNFGAGMAFPTNGEISMTLDFLPSWVSPLSTIDTNIYNQNKSYGVGVLGLERALDDFWKKVVMAGLGTLVENLPPGFDFPYRYTTAVIGSDVTVTRYPGGRATVDVTWTCPSGIWVYSDGTTKIHIR